ncbi:hypothetical protein FSARC_9880 [Fusarium sarcochroum]|uniref:Uncharacterized protein n=1 Tax=Fusarium sarcochroum TaxID=1208366 RepID=A0A8H4TQ59_9HYPO|nr:hypothetical protein FSARC_9880 [Fusarium sarcochroum]
MNGTQSPDAQKASNASTNGHNSNSSSLAAKKRKKDTLKPIITMEGASPQPDDGWGVVARCLVVCFNASGLRIASRHPEFLKLPIAKELDARQYLLIVLGRTQRQVLLWI